MPDTVRTAEAEKPTPALLETVVSATDTRRGPTVEAGSRPARMEVEYPITVLHQAWVSELRVEPEGPPRDGIELPAWLFHEAGFRFGERTILTRERCEGRDVEARNNRTVAPVFPWAGSHVRASGPTAMFLGRPGLSCLIAYGRADRSRAAARLPMADLSFPPSNRENHRRELAVRCDRGSRRFEGVPADAVAAMAEEPRELLMAQITGLVVQEAEDHCNPLLAMIPQPLMDLAGLGTGMVGAWFGSQSTSMAALHSYAVGSTDDRIASSGALAGAFPRGERFVVNVFGFVAGDASWAPRFVHLTE